MQTTVGKTDIILFHLQDLQNKIKTNITRKHLLVLIGNTVTRANHSGIEKTDIILFSSSRFTRFTK